MAEEGAGTNRPTLRALKIISGDKHLLAIQKGLINECSIGRRGTGGETVERVFVFQWCGKHCLLPKDFAGFSIETKQPPVLACIHVSDGEDVITMIDGGCVTVAR